MPFFPHKQLEPQKKIIYNLKKDTVLEANKNYVLGEHSNPNRILLSDTLIDSFHQLLKPPSTVVNNNTSILQVGFIIDTPNSFDFDLTTMSMYYQTCINMISKKFKNFTIHVLTDSLSFVKKIHLEHPDIVVEHYSNFALIQHCLLYDILVLSNSDISVWCGRLNCNPNKIIYYSNMIQAVRRKVPLDYRMSYPLNWKKIQSYEVTFTIIDLKGSTDFFSIDIVQKNLPLVLYVRENIFKKTEEKFLDLPNVKVRQLQKKDCKLYHNFPEESEEGLLRSDIVKCLYNVSTENEFDTKFFMIGNIEEYNLLDYKKLLKLLEKFSVDRMNVVQESKTMKIGTQKAILRYYQKYYSNVNKKNKSMFFLKEEFVYNNCDTSESEYSNFKFYFLIIFFVVCLLFIPFFFK
jgi:hypothetical protein